jgi:ATP-binding cassette, subfamily B, bacterial PglK
MISSLFLIKDLWVYISRKRKVQFLMVLTLMILTSFLEMISLGATLPFLGVLTSPELVYKSQYMGGIISLLEITNPSDLLLPITTIFVLMAVIAGIARIVLLYSITRLSFSLGADLGIDIYFRTLSQGYEVHLARNSSVVINNIIVKTNSVINHIFTPIMTLISSIVLLIGIMTMLLFVDIFVALGSFLFFGLVYLSISKYTHYYVNSNSNSISIESDKLMKSLQEGMGGIRDIILNHKQKFYCQTYRDADLKLRRAQGSNQFIGSSPRYIVESLGMVFIAILAYELSKDPNGMKNAIPVLGVLAVGAQRLLPALQQIYSSINFIKGGFSSFESVMSLLKQPLFDENKNFKESSIAFNKKVTLKDISFRYGKDSSYVLEGVNLEIFKGDVVGFIGSTGSGKSTLVDIVTGLMRPSKGKIKVDGVDIITENSHAWHKCISYVPQHIFLSDGTIEENIALGIDKRFIDHEKIKRASQQAQILQVVMDLPNGFETRVGENGVQLSGGQRQRIGIARAFYKEFDLLVMDEATSALDNETEGLVMNSVEELSHDKTVLIIAHRLTTLKKCDYIVKINNGKIIKIGTYSDLCI